jgi:hypothetical protein
MWFKQSYLDILMDKTSNYFLVEKMFNNLKTNKT